MGRGVRCVCEVYCCVVVKWKRVRVSEKGMGGEGGSGIVGEGNGVSGRGGVRSVGGWGRMMEKYEVVERGEGCKKCDGWNG